MSRHCEAFFKRSAPCRPAGIEARSIIDPTSALVIICASPTLKARKSARNLAGDFAQPPELPARRNRRRIGRRVLRPQRLARDGVPKNRKAVVVTFGGGARDDETFMPDGQENIPHLLNELMPQATFLTERRESGHPGPLRGDRQHRHRRLRNVQQFRRRLAQQSNRLRVLPQRSEAARDRRLGGRAQQWLRAHRRKRQQALRSRAGRGRDSSEAPAFRGAFVGSGRRPLSTSAARQLRNAALRAVARRPPDRTGPDGGGAQAFGGRFRGARAQSGQPRRALRIYREAA